MFKSLSKILLLSGAAMVGTSYFMASAEAEPKFMFRYVAGGGSGISNGGANNGGGVTEPEIPEEPEPETPQNTSITIGHGSLIHFDSNNDGAVNQGDRLTASFPISNTGDHRAVGITATNMVFYIESDMFGFHDQFPAAVTCPVTLAAKSSGECTATLVVSDSMLPRDWKKDYDFKVYLDNFNIQNRDDIVFSEGSDSVNLGSAQDIKLAYAATEGMTLDFDNNEFYISLFAEIESANNEEFDSPVVSISIPDLDNVKVPLNDCSDYNHSFKSISCRGRLELTSDMMDKIYSRNSDTYNLNVDVNLESLGGRSKVQTLASNENVYEHTLEYSTIQYISSSAVTITNSGTDIRDQEITINGLVLTNNSNRYIKNSTTGVYLGDGYDVLIKNICPAVSNMKPNQSINCGQIKYTLTPAQQQVLRDGFGRNRTVNANNQIYVSVNGTEDYDRYTYPMPLYNLVID